MTGRAAPLQALGAGLCVAASLPPWGWWPLAFAGLGWFHLLADDAGGPRRRVAIGWLFAAGWLFPGMAWMWFLTAPGYVVAAALFAGFHAVVELGVGRRGSVVARPAAHTAAEALRLCFPFGGVPLATLPIGQAGGPLLPVVRVGGVIGLTWLVGALSCALAEAGRAAWSRRQGPVARSALPRAAGVLVGCGLLIVTATVAPSGATSSGTPRSLRVAVVQGGGPQGTHAVHGDPAVVVRRHLDRTRTIAAGSTDLVLWPENVVDVPVFAGSSEASAIAAEARRIGAPIAVGVTEDTADDRFLNAQVVVGPDGALVSRYDKVRRVPFGEYMPLRGLLSALGAPTDLVPRDAVAGSGPAVVTLPDGTALGVAISWEVFFGGRVNEGVVHDGRAILNPTNGSSYTWTILQSQQVASSRLRAVEQGRWVVQAAPTGFSAFVSPDGEVVQRSSISEPAVLSATIELLDGRTWYSRLGNIPWVIAASLTWLLCLAASRHTGRENRRRRTILAPVRGFSRRRRSG